MSSDKELVRTIKSGNTRAFERLVRQYQRLVAHVVMRMIPNSADREDICQEVFIKVYQKLDEFRFECRLSSWIGRITYNTCVNHLQKKSVPLLSESMPDGRTVECLPSFATAPDDLSEERDMSRRLHEEIDRMPLHYGIVLTLYHLCEMGYAEIAQTLQLPLGTAKSHLFRARRLLKERLLARYELEELWHSGT